MTQEGTITYCPEFMLFVKKTCEASNSLDNIVGYINQTEESRRDMYTRNGEVYKLPYSDLSQLVELCKRVLESEPQFIKDEKARALEIIEADLKRDNNRVVAWNARRYLLLSPEESENEKRRQEYQREQEKIEKIRKSRRKSIEGSVFVPNNNTQ